MMAIATISMVTSGFYCHHSATKLTQPIDKLKKVGYNQIAPNLLTDGEKWVILLI